MQNVFKRIGLSLIWVSLAGVMLWRKDYNIALFGLIATMIFLIWTIDMKSITNLSLDWNKKKIEMNKMYEETKKAANEVEVSAKTFSKTIKAFLTFNLADLQTEGLMFMNIPWRDAAKFVDEAIELKRVLNEEDAELSYLLLRSKSKVIELFKMNAHELFSRNTEGNQDYEKCISSGLIRTPGMVTFNADNIAIDFQGLYDLTSKVSAEKQLAWKKSVDDLKIYYDNNF